MSIKHYESEKQTSGDFTITKPASLAEGDLIVAIKLSTANGFTGTFTPPAGFSAVTTYDVDFSGLSGTNRKEEFHVTYKVASASEPSSYLFDTQYSGSAYIFFLVLDGRDGTVGQVFTDAADYVGTSFTLPLTGYTAAAGDDVFAIGCVAGGTAMTSVSTPTGYTLRTDRATETQSPSKSVSLEGLSAGATGSIDFGVVSPAGTFAATGLVLSFPAATAALTIDSTDATMQRNTDFQVVCSTPTTTPTTGNTTLSNGNDTLTPSSVTGSDPYTLTFPVGDLTKQVDATGYDWTLEITP